MWLQPAAWGFCFVLTLVAAIFYRREARVGALLRYSAFPVITVLFFMVVAFSRYAAVAERQQQQWAAVGKPVMHGNPDEFDFARWCWVTGRNPQYQPTAPTPSGLQVRTRLLERLASLGMEEQTMALVAATALGDRTLLRRDTRDLYSRVGASHLLALSGLHLGIIVGLFLTWMNGRLLLSRWRWPVGMMVLLFIWTYTFVAGMPTSLLRAALMTSIFVLASLMQRYGSPLQHLLLAAIVMMLWRPTVVFDVGAQLSFLAVAGILLFYRPLYMWFFDRWRYQIFSHLWHAAQHCPDTADDPVPHGFVAADCLVMAVAVGCIVALCRRLMAGGLSVVDYEPCRAMARGCDSRFLEP